MLSNNKLVYLITGANRGIGLGILTVLAARPDTVVFAGCLKMSLADEADNAAAIAEIENKVGRLDVVIANAAVPSANPSVATLSLPNLRETFEFNTVGMVVLYQAAHKLLLASPTGAPIFAYISSSVGSLASHLDFHMTSYGVSKAASNFIICELHAQNPSLIAMAIHPGWVQTKMGNEGARVAPAWPRRRQPLRIRWRESCRASTEPPGKSPAASFGTSSAWSGNLGI
ncbi:NAD(P)-binding protein [Mycena kentingensis (nom. inval.)]|nr:NAD(P)-binding protein [Mycena kentingensis (nom. inval.)]